MAKRYSGYRKRGNQSALLRRLAYRLAPTSRQVSGQGKRFSRGSPEGLVKYMAYMNEKMPNMYNEAQLIKMYGKGGYWGKRFGGWLGDLFGGNETIKGWTTSAFDSLGDTVSSMVPGGSFISKGAEKLAVALGHGAYQIQQPGSAPSTAMQVGTFSAGDVETINIQSREYLGAVNGSAPFLLSTLVINPGNIQAFPQLSRLAMHYEQYRFNGLIFWYHSTSGESTNSADTAIGELMMTNQPDSTDAAPITKQQFVRTGSAKQAKPSIDQLHGIECAGAPMRLIRHGDPSEVGREATAFDFGKFHLAVEGCNAAVTRLGELWVTYDIDLIRSRDSKGQETASFRADTNSGATANLFNAAVIKYNSLPLVLSANTVTFPQFVNDGDYEISLTLTNAATAASSFVAQTPVITAISQGVTILNSAQNFSNGGGGAGDNSSDSIVSNYVIRVNAPGATQASITFGATAIWPAAFPGSATGRLRVFVKRIPQDLYL